ncbi:MAG: 50S ribosomal protein L44e [archaeon]
MKIPKEINTHCPHCKKHSKHKLKEFKAGKMRTMSKGTRSHEKQHKKGYGGKAEFVPLKKKQTRKPTFVATCSTCKKKHYYVIPKRMKFEFAA